jgi:hypothetical protein
MRPLRLRWLALGISGAVLTGVAPAAVASITAGRGLTAASATDPLTRVAESPWVDPESVRRDTPASRYEPAGGCYRLRSLATGKYVERRGAGFAATATAATTAEPLHFQAYDLGKYLLFGRARDYVAADRPETAAPARAAVETGEGSVRGTGDETLNPARAAVLPATGAAKDAASTGTQPADGALSGDAVVAAAKPSGAAEWVLRQAGKAFRFELPVDDQEPAEPGPLDPAIAGTLSAGANGVLVVVDGSSTTTATQFGLERTTGCAKWPEIRTQVTGAPGQGQTAYGETAGYFDAHLHAMAFEFLGGEAHCGRPWHPYGVTVALVDCPDHKPGGYGAVMEQLLSGQMGGHDTAGWPKFTYWPDHGSYTHETTYYSWIERAWRGGLRMTTNLLVENGVLCEIYPHKRNSCNEMDAVR